MLTVAVLLAQSRSGEIGRGFPYSSEGGGGMGWTMVIFIVVLIVLLAIAFKVKDKLAEHSWWHTVLVAIATLFLAVFLAAALNGGHGDMGALIFVLLPSFAGVGLLYLLIIGLVEFVRDKLSNR